MLETESGSFPVEPMSATSLLSVVGSLLLVLIAFFLLAWLLKRLQQGRGGATGIITLIGDLPLGPKERVLLLQVGDTQLLVGSSTEGLRTLHTLDKPVDMQDPAVQQGGFAERLRGAMTRRSVS